MKGGRNHIVFRFLSVFQDISGLAYGNPMDRVRCFSSQFVADEQNRGHYV